MPTDSAAAVALLVAAVVVLAGCASAPLQGQTPDETATSAKETTATAATASTVARTTTTTTTRTTRATLSDRRPHFRFRIVAHGDFTATVRVTHADGNDSAIAYNRTHRLDHSTLSLDDDLRTDIRYRATVRVNGTPAWNGTLLPSYGYRLHVYPNGTASAYWETG